MTGLYHPLLKILHSSLIFTVQKLDGCEEAWDKTHRHPETTPSCLVTISLSPLLSLGEYIALYQMQREALRVKFQEKDRFIQEIMAEKTITQVGPHLAACETHHLMCNAYSIS